MISTSDVFVVSTQALREDISLHNDQIYTDLHLAEIDAAYATRSLPPHSTRVYQVMTLREYLAVVKRQAQQSASRGYSV